MKHDQRIREAIMKIKERLKGPCPDEETLAAFLEERLGELERAEVAAHILACEGCREAAMAAQGDLPRRLRVPVEVMQKAASVLPAKESTWEIVVSFASDFVEVIKNTSARTQYFAPAYASARSPKAAKASLVACADHVAGIDTELEIERVGPGAGELKVNLKEGGGTPSPPVRVTLKRNGKELASYIAPQGIAVFERVSIGTYDIVLSRKGIPLGEITLEMKGEQQ